ncbi:MAG: adenylate/guanylate cyclase domain-containing protein [Rhodospirillales bacterium]|nr:adenylate/guanylate cyclase domain-containing protein [Alphaproteobacteria bacterium]MBL6948520.1 adenylate/guanylate cyclase domain-containing protein [Rhodospirillales bacterium]
MLKFLRSAFSFERLLGMALLAGFLTLYVVDPYPVEFLRLKTFDYFQQVKPREIPPPQGKPVTIIDLDEESLAEIGQWPWPRTAVAKLIGNLMQMGAALVAFDIVFAEPDRMNPNRIPDTVVGLDEATIAKLRALPSNDEILARMVKRSRVVLGQAGYWEKLESKKGPPIKKSVALLKQGKNVEPSRFLPRFQSLIRNVPVFEKEATGHGIFSLVPEPDGIVRRVPTLFAFEKGLYPSLSVEMLRVAFNRKSILVKANAAGITYLGVHKKLQLPTDNRGRVWPYFSKSDKSKYVSAKDVLNGTADPSLIKGKLTIVGTSAVGLLDIRAVPTEPVIPGVEVHVQLIEAALHKKWLSRPNYFVAAELSLILLGGLLMIILVPWAGAKWGMAAFLLVAGGAGATSWYLFAGIDVPMIGLNLPGRLLFDSGYAIISILFMYMVLTYTSYAREEAERRQTRDAFSKYLSPDMVNRVAENPGELKLGGDKREMTLLFCDVRGFTTISEQFDAVGLTALINKLLTPLTNAILDRQGTVDKYMGDCIMAFWNAPLDDDDHAYHGCVSALAMLAEMGPLNDRLEVEAEEEGRKHIPLKVGLGLNSGECVVGNMGSDQRFDYSVLGDTVNLAARLEGQSKSYGMNVVLGPTTNAAVEDRMATIDLDFIQVKGKTEGTYIYGLMGDAELKASPVFVNVQKKIQDAMESYRQQRFDEAAEMFKEIRVLGDERHRPWHLDVNLDVLCDLYEERIAEYKINPPAADWDGVFIATTK